MASTSDLANTEFRWSILYQQDILQARLSLDLAVKGQDHIEQYAFIRDSIIAYARPFSSNRSPTGGTHVLARKVVPRPMRPLHDHLIRARNRLIAHTDFAARNPRVTSYANGVKFVAFAHADMSALIARAEEIRGLFGAIDNELSKRISRWAGDVVDDEAGA